MIELLINNNKLLSVFNYLSFIIPISFVLINILDLIFNIMNKKIKITIWVILSIAWIIVGLTMSKTNSLLRDKVTKLESETANRTITKEQRESIINVLKQYPNTEISLLFVNNINAKKYAIEFRKIFKTANWHLSKFTPIMVGYLPNVILEIPEIIPYPFNNPFRTLYDIFRENNIDIRYKITPGVNSPTLIIGDGIK